MLHEIGQAEDDSDTDSTLDGFEMSDCRNSRNGTVAVTSEADNADLYLDQDVEIMDISVFSEEVVISTD